jgi:hypothetical protein
MKFCIIIGKNARNTCGMLSEAYGGEIMKKSSVFEWHKPFKEGLENMEGDERSYRPRSCKPMKLSKKCRIWCVQVNV